jgi:uncharacterized protein YjdB
MLKKMTVLNFRCLILTIILFGIGVVFFLIDFERRNIDLNANNIKIVLSESEWTKNNVELTIAYNKSLNHIKEYSFDNGKTWTKSNLIALENNENLLIKIKDINDRIYDIEYSVGNIDKEGPIILTQPNIQVGVNSKIALKDYVTVYDEGVGLREEVVLTPATIDSSKLGTYTIQIYAIDKLANKSISKMDVQVVDTLPNINAHVLDLNKNVLSLNIGEEEKLNALISPKNTTNKNITWKSDDLNIATVDNTGKITGISKGYTIISAQTSNGIKTYCIVIVK